VLAAASALVAIGLDTRGPRNTTPLRSNVWRDTADVVRTPGIAGALVVSVVVFGVTDLLTLYLPVYGTDARWSVGFVAALLATRAGAAVAIRLVFGRLVEALGRRALLVAGCLVGIASAVAFPFAGDGWGPFLCVAVFGAAVGMGQPITMAWVARSAPAHLRSTSLGVRLTANQVWLLVVPPAIGLIVGLAGPASLFFSIGALLAATLAPSARGPR
jgi:MFS family permease